jgi:hypothetical protein
MAIKARIQFWLKLSRCYTFTCDELNGFVGMARRQSTEQVGGRRKIA